MTMTKQQVLKLEISTEIYLLILILKVNNIIRFHNEAWRKLVSLLSVIILRQFQYPQRDTQILISIESIRCRHSLKNACLDIYQIYFILLRATSPKVWEVILGVILLLEHLRDTSFKGRVRRN